MSAARIWSPASNSRLLRIFGPVRHATRFLESFVASQTHAKGDIEARDRVAERVIEDSTVGHAIASTRASIESAWAWSRTGRAIRQVEAIRDKMTPIDRIRLASGIALVASVTALALRFFAGRPAPLVWIVPSAVAMGAAAMLTATHRVAGRT